jgi:hypothetical protein
MPTNWASSDEGAEVVEVSHEASHIISSANNVLVEREDMLWISGTLPQHIVIRIAPNHPPIRYVGWYVWQHYLTNPKTVEISSGVVEGCLSPIMICTGLPGAGKQLWELEEPIPSAHTFIRFKVTATFGASSTYMNRVYLYSDHPGDGFTAPPSSAANQTGATGDPNNNSLLPTSPLKMTSMLKELDEEIRMLHPLRNLSPSRGAFTHSSHSHTEYQGLPAPPPLSTPSFAHGTGYDSHNASHSSVGIGLPPQFSPGSYRRERDVNRGGAGATTALGADATATTVSDERLQGLEQTMKQLVQLVQSQRQEMNGMRQLIEELQGGGGAGSGNGTSGRGVSAQGDLNNSRHPSPSSRGTHRSGSASGPQLNQSTHSQPMPFPESALRHYVEEVMAPRLEKYRQRIETRVLQRVDEAVHDIEKDVRRMVEDRVRRYIYDIATNSEHPFHPKFVQASDDVVHSRSTSRAGQVGGLEYERRHVTSRQAHRVSPTRERPVSSMGTIERSRVDSSIRVGSAAFPMTESSFDDERGGRVVSKGSKGRKTRTPPVGHRAFEEDYDHQPQ